MKKKGAYDYGQFIEFTDESFLVGDILAEPFRVSHDVPCVGFVFSAGGETIIEPLAEAIERALTDVEDSADTLLRQAAEKETEPAAKWALSKLVENNEVAKKTCSFACQDTGLAVVFAEMQNNLII